MVLCRSTDFSTAPHSETGLRESRPSATNESSGKGLDRNHLQNPEACLLRVSIVEIRARQWQPTGASGFLRHNGLKDPDRAPLESERNPSEIEQPEPCLGRAHFPLSRFAIGE